MGDELQKKPTSTIYRNLEENIFQAGLPDAHVTLVDSVHEAMGVPTSRDAVGHEFNAIRILRQKFEMRASQLYEYLCEMGAVDELRQATGIVLTADRLIAYTNDLFQQRVDEEANRLRDEGSDHHKLLTSDRLPGLPTSVPKLFTTDEIAVIKNNPEAIAQVQGMQDIFDANIGKALNMQAKPRELGL